MYKSPEWRPLCIPKLRGHFPSVGRFSPGDPLLEAIPQSISAVGLTVQMLGRILEPEVKPHSLSKDAISEGV